METHPGAEYEGLVGWILTLMETIGEFGVGIAVFLETFIPPIPSEALLPGAGFLAYDGRLNFWLAWFMATLGALVGAWVWYAIGAVFGRERTRWVVGKIPLMDHDDFDRAEAFFTRWGGTAVLVGRCVPLVRSFISIPAGIERMSLVQPVYASRFRSLERHLDRTRFRLRAGHQADTRAVERPALRSHRGRGPAAPVVVRDRAARAQRAS
jgi:membrane protein YqaA with SNARE-associated domain